MEMLSVSAPSSKSVSHRMLIGAALAAGESVVERVLESRDPERTRAVLTAAGASFEPLGSGSYRVRGVAGRPQGTAPHVHDAEPVSCDVHESGTTCRLLTAVLASGQGRFRIHGAPRMHQRPLGGLTGALEQLGAAFQFEEKPGYPPFVLEATGLAGGSVGVGLGESSQYLSGLLLAAPQARGPLTIEITGEHVVSWPYVGLTLQAMRDFGIHFDVSVRAAADQPWRAVDWRAIEAARPGLVRFRVRPSTWRPGHYVVEGDWSGASYLLAAGALGPLPVTVNGLRPDTLQGDRAIRDILLAMGARVDVEHSVEPVRPVTAYPSALRGVDVDMSACPDLVPTVAVLAAAAEGDTRIRGVAHLRIKESDRIAAPARELGKAGVSVEERDDGMVIHGQGADFDLTGRTLELNAWGDHRMAMSLALLECRGARVRLDDPAVVGKSFPAFWETWRTIRKTEPPADGEGGQA